MIRIKTLGLAVIAALALSVTAGASSASAGYFAVTAGTTGYTGSPGTQTYALSGGRTGTCAGEYLSGTVTNQDKTLSPYMPDMSCESFEGPVSWKMNGCKISFTPGVEGTGPGTFTIGPAGCSPISLTSKYCTRLIGAQSGKASFSNQGSGVAISIQEAFLQSSVAKESPTCKPETISYFASWTVTPNNGVVQLTSSQVGVYLGGSGFAAESYPVSLTGTQDATSVTTLTRASRQYKCTQADMAGQLASTSGTLTLAPKYTGCLAYVGGITMPAEIEANSCAYTVGSTGSFGVSCSEAGDAIKITLYSNTTKQSEGIPLCVYRIAPQTSGSTIGLSTFGEGNKRGVALAFSANALTSERTVGTTGNCGEKGENVKYGGTTNVTGEA